ncbi:MAG: hypothetical protein GY943_22825 [Chloroflexi bacterium]|nr:hypothetical protein [Chloroflexota bacterium]
MIQSTQIRNAIGKAAAPMGAIGAVGGFISDVLAPLGNLAPWVAGLSFLIFIGTVITYFGMLRRPGMEPGESLMPAILVISAGSTIIFAGWSILFANGPDNGYLAENVEPIAQIQASLLGLEEDVAEIKETTEETAVQVEEIATVQADIQDTGEETADQVDAIATAQAQGFADIQSAFAALQSSQSIIENPTTPQEWYSNARLYQLRGDTANAIAAYEGYFSFNLEYVDPYLEYTNLLKATEGIARTRQIVSDMLNLQPDSKTLDMMLATLFDLPEDRLARLEALAQRAPEYAPVFYELGQEYSSALRANFTQNLQDQQSGAFTTLFQLEENQLYSSHFIDKSRAQENLDQAQVTFESFAGVALLELDFLPFYSYEGVTIIVLLPEGNVEELRFSLDNPNPTNNTGSSSFGGQSFANTTIGPIPLEKGEHTLYVQYTDATGVESDMFIYEYTVEDIVINYQQQPFDFSLDGIPAIFTMAVVDEDPNALFTFNYSIDSDALDENIQGVGQAGVIQIGPIEVGEHVLHVQAVGPGGVTTDVVTFPFTVE